MKFKMDEIGNLELSTNESGELIELGKMAVLIPGAKTMQRSDLGPYTYSLECRINEVINALLKK
jgi:hypothetical protein